MVRSTQHIEYIETLCYPLHCLVHCFPKPLILRSFIFSSVWVNQQVSFLLLSSGHLFKWIFEILKISLLYLVIVIRKIDYLFSRIPMAIDRSNQSIKFKKLSRAVARIKILVCILASKCWRLRSYLTNYTIHFSDAGELS